MAELNTKSISELDILQTLQSSDHILVESDGMMKRIGSSMVGGNNNIGVCVIDLSEYEDKIMGSISEIGPLPSQGGNVE